MVLLQLILKQSWTCFIFFILNHIVQGEVNERERSEGELSTAACLNILSHFQNNKIPGNKGLTIEFYRAFWPLLGNMLVNSLNYSYKHGELSASQKREVVVLIEKKDRDQRQFEIDVFDQGWCQYRN